MLPLLPCTCALLPCHSFLEPASFPVARASPDAVVTAAAAVAHVVVETADPLKRVRRLVESSLLVAYRDRDDTDAGSGSDPAAAAADNNADTGAAPTLLPPLHASDCILGHPKWWWEGVRSGALEDSSSTAHFRL